MGGWDEVVISFYGKKDRRRHSKWRHTGVTDLCSQNGFGFVKHKLFNLTVNFPL